MSFYICNYSHSYQCQHFRYWARVTLYFRCRPTSARITKAHRPLSLFSAVRDIHSYPQARYSTTRLFSMPNCDLSIAAVSFSFNGEVGLNSIYIGGRIETKNPLKTPQIHPSQSGILLHGRANLSCSPRTDSFAISKRPCSIVHGEGWYKASNWQQT